MMAKKRVAPPVPIKPAFLKPTHIENCQLEGILSKPKSQEIFPSPKKSVCFSPEALKSKIETDVTFSLTEVSSMRAGELVDDTKLDDTLDFSLSDDQGLDSTKSTKRDDPPLQNDTDEEEDDLSFGPLPPSPTESVDFIVPPPPPLSYYDDDSFGQPPIGLSSDEEESTNQMQELIESTNQTHHLIKATNQITDPVKSTNQMQDLKTNQMQYVVESTTTNQSEYLIKSTNQMEDLIKSANRIKETPTTPKLKNTLRNNGTFNKPKNNTFVQKTRRDSTPYLFELQNKIEESSSVKVESGNEQRKNVVDVTSEKNLCKKFSPDIDSGHGFSSEFSDVEVHQDSKESGNIWRSGNGSSQSFSSVNTVIYQKPPQTKNDSWIDSSSESESEEKVNIREMLIQHMKNIEHDNIFEETMPTKSSREIDEKPSEDDEGEGRLNELDVCDWTPDDVTEWLELIGLSHLRKVFLDHRIDGKSLTDINNQLLDEMSINCEEDREMILSEIYALHNADDDLEASILDALDGASESERKKLLSLIDTLNNTEEEENNYLSSTSQSLLSPREVTKDLIKEDDEKIEEEKVDGKVTNETESVTPEKAKKKKRGLFASLRKRREKKSKSAIVGASMAMMIQCSPQGMIKIMHSDPPNNKTVDVNLLASLNTTAGELCKMALQSMALHEDYKTFDLEMTEGKTTKTLKSEECPLVYQCKTNCTFQMEHNPQHYIMVNKEDLEEQETTSVKMAISSSTSVSDLIPILLKRFHETDNSSSFHLHYNDEVVAANTLILSLPLCGYKIHVLKLLNNAAKTKNRQLTKTLENEVASLQKENVAQTNTIRSLNRSLHSFSTKNRELDSALNVLKEESSSKDIELNKLKKQLAQLDKGSSPTNGSMDELSLHVEHLEQRLLILRQAKLTLEKDVQQKQTLCVSLQLNNEDLTGKVKELEKSLELQKETDSKAQLKKLTNENKEQLKTIYSLEEKLNEVQYKCTQQLFDENEDALLEDLQQKKMELEHKNIEKDSKILELEYTIQKKDRELLEKDEAFQEEMRRKKREMADENTDQIRNARINLQSLQDEMREKEIEVNEMKAALNKQEKKLTKQRTLTEIERNEKEEVLNDLKKRHLQQIQILEEKVEGLQKLLMEKSLSNKKYEFECSKEREERITQIKDLERRLMAKDVIIERLENKLSKADLSCEKKIKEQQDEIKNKDEQINWLEVDVARLENETAVSLRESTNSMRNKDAVISKLENKIKKQEQNNRENGHKIEKYMLEKNQLLQQMTADREKENKCWKTRQRQYEDELNEKEQQIKEVTTNNTQTIGVLEGRLKKREKEFNQQKHLLEQVLQLVNTRAPNLVKDITSNFQQGERRRNLAGDSPVKDEWC